MLRDRQLVERAPRRISLAAGGAEGAEVVIPFERFCCGIHRVNIQLRGHKPRLALLKKARASSAGTAHKAVGVHALRGAEAGVATRVNVVGRADLDAGAPEEVIGAAEELLGWVGFDKLVRLAWRSASGVKVEAVAERVHPRVGAGATDNALLALKQL